MGKTLTMGYVMIDRRSTRAYWVMSLCEEAAQQLQQAYGAWSLRFRCQRAEIKAMPSHRSPCNVRSRCRVVVCIFAAQQHFATSDGGCDKPSAAEAITTIVGETGQHSKADAKGRCGNTWDKDCFGTVTYGQVHATCFLTALSTASGPTASRKLQKGGTSICKSS
jgi:hypothetical protein